MPQIQQNKPLLSAIQRSQTPIKTSTTQFRGGGCITKSAKKIHTKRPISTQDQFSKPEKHYHRNTMFTQQRQIHNFHEPKKTVSKPAHKQYKKPAKSKNHHKKSREHTQPLNQKKQRLKSDPFKAIKR